MASNTRKKRFPLPGVLLFLVLLLAGGVYLLLHNKAEKALPYLGHGGTFKNTLAEIDTPDPSVVYKDGYYYMTFTHNGTDIMVMKARTLDFRQAERKVVWYPPAESAYSANLWAPELQYLRGHWYIYFAADDGNNENHRMYALQADSADPMGAYTFKGQITDDSNKWAIDGLTMEYENKLYFVWSGWEGEVNVAQNTYIAPMSDPLTVSGPRVLLSEPELAWEKAGGPPYINEGQAILHKDGRVFIVYSGAGSWTPHYSLGLLALQPGSDPLDPAGWVKSAEPLLAMDEEASVYGPGHNSFVSSPDGSEQWIVYHATPGAADGWNNRKARAQRVGWSGEGLPVFGKPLPLSAAIEVPAGTGVFHADHAVRSGNRLEFPALPAAVESTVPLLLHYTNRGEQAGAARIFSGGGAESALELPPTKEGEMGYVYGTAAFSTGMNQLGIEVEGQQTELAAIEIPRYEAESAILKGEEEAEENPFASGGGLVALNGSGDSLRFSNVRVPAQGKYTLTLAVMNVRNAEASLDVAVNGGRKTAVGVEKRGRNERSTVNIELELQKGANEISIFDRQEGFSIDYMDVWLQSAAQE